MRKFWILDQHDGDGPTALVQTDGRMRIVDVLQFGPGISSIDQQQELWDRLIGGLAPTMKPLVDAGSIRVEGEPVSSELKRRDTTDTRSKTQAGPARSGSRGSQGGRAGGESNRRGSRGDR